MLCNDSKKCELKLIKIVPLPNNTKGEYRSDFICEKCNKLATKIYYNQER